MFNIDEMLDEVENTTSETEAVMTGSDTKPEADMTIVVKNAVNGRKITMPVYRGNQLEQIVAGCKKTDAKDLDIGLNLNSSNFIYANERTRESTTDGTLTVEEFKLKDKDVLSISDDGKVAGK